MKNKVIKKVILSIMILIPILPCAKDSNEVNTDKNYDINSVFIIDFDVRLYSDKESDKVTQILKYFEPIVVLQDNLGSNDRIKVRLTNGNEGWVQEKYTSYIPKGWVKKEFDDIFFLYFSSDQEIQCIKEINDSWSRCEYKNNDYNIIYVINYELDYATIKKQYEDGIKLTIAYDDKKLNWNKEFYFGVYKVNYVITTDDPDGMIIESFDFIKVNEEKQKKDYSFSTTYNRTKLLEKRLIQKKILFSALQSLK